MLFTNLKKYKIAVILLFGIALAQPVVGEQQLFERELVFKGGYVSNPADDGNKAFFIPAAGFEFYKKLSNEYGDFLTQNLQLRFTWDLRETPKDAWAIEIHNAWVEFKLGLGKTLRVGHFQPYFGMEVVEDTHGKLFQTLMMQNIGFKHDWGVGYSTFAGPFDLRIGAQLGYGMSFHKYQENYLFTTRISSPDGRNTNVALSGLWGRVFTIAHDMGTAHGDQMGMMAMPKEVKPMLMFDEHVHRTIPAKTPGPIVRKWRTGYDFSHFGAYINLKHEAAIGKDDDKVAGATMLQMEYSFSFNDEFVTQFQVKAVTQDITDKRKSYIPVTAGLSYTVLNYLTFQCAYEATILPFAERSVENHKALFQIYYFGT